MLSQWIRYSTLLMLLSIMVSYPYKQIYLVKIIKHLISLPPETIKILPPFVSNDYGSLFTHLCGIEF